MCTFGFRSGAGRLFCRGRIDTFPISFLAPVANGARFIAFYTPRSTGKTTAPRALMLFLIGGRLQDRRLLQRRGRVNGRWSRRLLSCGRRMPKGDTLRELNGTENGIARELRRLLDLQRILNIMGHGGLGRRRE